MVQDEIAAYLTVKGVGTLSANIFTGSKSIIPSGDGPYLQLTETGGTNPRRSTTSKTQRPSLQVLVRAKRYKDARLMCKQAYDVLDGVYNDEISGVQYVSITARQEPTDIGVDAASRVMIAFNIDVEKAPS